MNAVAVDSLVASGRTFRVPVAGLAPVHWTF